MPHTPPPDPGTPPKPETDAPDEEPASKDDEILDEELEETFPASDPRPWTHRD